MPDSQKPSPTAQTLSDQSPQPSQTPPEPSGAEAQSPKRQGDFSTLSSEQQREAVEFVKRIVKMEEAIRRGEMALEPPAELPAKKGGGYEIPEEEFTTGNQMPKNGTYTNPAPYNKDS